MPIIWTQSIEKAYQDQKSENARSSILIALFVGTFMNPAFISLDYMIHRQVVREFVLIRIINSAFYPLFFWLTYRRIYIFRSTFVMTLLPFFITAASLTSFCVLLGGYTSNYYAGLLIVLVLGNIFPWTAAQMTVQAMGVIFIYAVVMLIQARFQIEKPDIFLVNLYVLFSVGVVSIIFAGISERLRKRNFQQIVEIEQAKDEISKLLQIRTRFFANVSHELRTPLALILGPARRLLSLGALPEQSEIELKTVERNVRVVLRHVNDLLDAAKGDSGTGSIHFHRVDLCSLIRLCASRFEHLASERGDRFYLDLPASFMGEVDPQKVDKIVTNFLSNAFKFTPKGGTIRVQAFREQQNAASVLVLKVSDSGPGIPPELRSHVFERFYQVEESSNRRHGGTGLGLAIAKDCVELHRGEISVGQSREGGAEFTVVLPLQAPAGSIIEDSVPVQPLENFEELPHLSTDSVSPEVSSQNGAGTILVVEDNVEMSAFLQRILSPRWRVETAYDGRQALQSALSLRPDVILTDLMMPDVSGEELLVAVREHAELADIPVIVLTAKADDSLRSELLLKGAQDFQLKPFSPEELIARISIWMEVKRSREVLQRELKTHQGGLVHLVQEIAEKSNQLQNALVEAEKAKAKAQKARELRDQFISVASHELRTPLTALKLQIQVSQLTETNSPVSTSLRSMDRQINHLSRLVNEMFDLSRIDQGQLVLKKGEFGVVSLLQSIIEKYEHQLKGRAEILNRTLEDDPMVEWDRFRMEQVFTNLLINAMKYGAGRLIRFIVEGERERVSVRIEDQGIGIAIEDQERIFEKFERCVPYEKISGLGLGLYISREIVRAHKGKMAVESRPGEGSVFSVSLPRRPQLAVNASAVIEIGI